MAVREFGKVSRGVRARRVAGMAMLLGTTALVMLPRAEAAGVIEDPSRLDLGYEYYGIPALSADGTIFVGNVYDEFNDLYTGYYGHPGGVTSLPAFGNGTSRIYGMSGDARWVVGYSQNLAGYNRAFLWDAPDGLAIDLGLLYPNIPNAHSVATDVSGDGSRVAGAYSRVGMTRAFAWIRDATTGEDENEQMYGLSSLDDANHWAANAISDDGRYVVGYSNGNATTSLAVRWDISGLEAGGVGSDVILNLGSLTGVDNGQSMALDVSADGSVVVGYSADDVGFNKAFRWVEGSTGGDADNVQMHNLGALGHDPVNQSAANAVSRDGEYVVGWSEANLPHRLAFRWSEETGMESVHDWLGRNGVSMGDVALTDASAISDNGQVIAGMMELADGNVRAYIARVTAEPEPDPEPNPDPEPDPEPQPGSGIMDVEEYHRSLLASVQVAQAGEFLTWLPLNGAHHRPLMMQGRLSENACMWATGDLGHHGGSNTGLALAEVGACVDLFGGNVRAGLGVGTSQSWQPLALGGRSRLSGQYVTGEVDWQPEGTPLLLSLAGMLGGWTADIHRGYSNGATAAYSDGSTQVGGGVVRLRADWLEAATIGNTTINPWASVAVGRTDIAGYVETGGPFPARFDSQSITTHEVRLGVTAVSELSDTTTLSSTLEVAHRGGTAARSKGNVLGLFDFDMGGGNRGNTWARVGAELDHRIGDNAMVSVSLNAATHGQDATIGGSIGFKAAF